MIFGLGLFFFPCQKANLIEKFIKAMKPGHVEEGASCLLWVKLRQRTWQKCRRLPHTCTPAKNCCFSQTLPGTQNWYAGPSNFTTPYNSSLKFSVVQVMPELHSPMVLKQLRKNYGCGFLKLLSPGDTNDGLFALPFYFIKGSACGFSCSFLLHAAQLYKNVKILTQRRLN